MSGRRLTPTRTGIRSQLAGLLCVAFLAAAPASSLAAGEHAGHGAMPEPRSPSPGSQTPEVDPQVAPESLQHGSGHGNATSKPSDADSTAAEGDHGGASGGHGSDGATDDKREADAAAKQQHDSHGEAGEPAADRPVKLVLGGFAAVNVLVILAAAVLRRRPAAVKRRATLARVRAGAGARSGKKDRS